MKKKLACVAALVITAFIAAQLVRPSRDNPPTDPGRAIRAHVPADLSAVLDRSCRDCHSNATVWPRYARVAPLSWLMASAVTKGRGVINFSEWASYSPAERQLLLTMSCESARAGRMPGLYGRLQPETRLSTQDVETICAAARH